jgi:hypothetical protein
MVGEDADLEVEVRPAHILHQPPVCGYTGCLKGTVPDLAGFIYHEINFSREFLREVPHFELNNFVAGDTAHIFAPGIGFFGNVPVHLCRFSNHRVLLLLIMLKSGQKYQVIVGY